MLRPLLIAATGLLVAFLDGTQAAAPQQRVTVVLAMSSLERPFDELLHGVRAGLSEAIPDADVRIVSPEKLASETQADVVVGVGSAGTRAALAATAPEKVVACMLLGESGGERPSQTVALEFPPEVELSWLRRILPEARRIGILHHDEATRRRAEQMRAAASATGLEIIMREVPSPRDLPAALDWIAARVDVLWGIPDGVVLSPHSAETILLFTLRNRLPFVGASESWVRGGALFAVERDYRDVGRQCAEAVGRVLRGEKGGERVAPRRALPAVNLRTARTLKRTIPAEVLDDARRVVE